MSEKRLQGLRVAVLAVDGFEQVEVTIPVRALQREGADVRIVSLRPGRIRGMNFLFRGKKLPVDETVARARPDQYGALLLPGGFVNPDLLRQSKRALEFVRQFDALERPIVTLCHGPELRVDARGAQANPASPETNGVVTSSTGATRRRPPRIHLRAF
ncbi:MAG TPA: DJ-1/PfpI family protein [Polyangia bacterium]|nr:DJ-1/PfpI family protein [Polyangia bacterium]